MFTVKEINRLYLPVTVSGFGEKEGKPKMQSTQHATIEPINEVLQGPLAWSAADLKESDWKHELSSQCLDEIKSVLGHLERHPLPTILLSPSDFTMPACEAVMISIRKNLDEGCGFALVDRLPIDGMSKEEGKAIYWLLSSMLSRPVAQKLDGTMIYDVHDTGAKAAAGSGVRPDKTNIDLTFHNDNSYNDPMPDYVGLLCLQPAKSGGVSKVMSFQTAHNALLEKRSNVLHRLYAPFIFDRQREFFPGEDETISAPVFDRDGELTARLGIHQVRNAYEMTAMPMDEETTAAIDALEQVFDDPDLQFRFTMEAGQIQFVNNKVIGHSRTEFQDFDDLDKRRHLVRIWMRDKGDRSYCG
jgi:alpha-ketoglutarate-dependent taurine dioxygenase